MTQRHKGDVMVEIRGESRFYHILTTDSNDSGYASSVQIHVAYGDLFGLQNGGGVDVNAQYEGATRVWFTPEDPYSVSDPPVVRDLRDYIVSQQVGKRTESTDMPAAPLDAVEA